jgi:hypothetical protein
MQANSEVSAIAAGLPRINDAISVIWRLYCPCSKSSVPFVNTSTVERIRSTERSERSLGRDPGPRRGRARPRQNTQALPLARTDLGRWRL